MSIFSGFNLDSKENQEQVGQPLQEQTEAPVTTTPQITEPVGGGSADASTIHPDLISQFGTPKQDDTPPTNEAPPPLDAPLQNDPAPAVVPENPAPMFAATEVATPEQVTAETPLDGSNTTHEEISQQVTAPSPEAPIDPQSAPSGELGYPWAKESNAPVAHAQQDIPSITQAQQAESPVVTEINPDGTLKVTPETPVAAQPEQPDIPSASSTELTPDATSETPHENALPDPTDNLLPDPTKTDDTTTESAIPTPSVVDTTPAAQAEVPTPDVLTTESSPTTFQPQTEEVTHEEPSTNHADSETPLNVSSIDDYMDKKSKIEAEQQELYQQIHEELRVLEEQKLTIEGKMMELKNLLPSNTETGEEKQVA